MDSTLTLYLVPCIILMVKLEREFKFELEFKFGAFCNVAKWSIPNG